MADLPERIEINEGFHLLLSSLPGHGVPAMRFCVMCASLRRVRICRTTALRRSSNVYTHYYRL
jgi:hypothetical protein